jgi:hypothetical protein
LWGFFFIIEKKPQETDLWISQRINKDKVYEGLKEKKEKMPFLFFGMAVGFITVAAAKMVVCLEKNQNSFWYFVYIKAVCRFPFAFGTFVPLLEDNLFYGHCCSSFGYLIPKDSCFAAATSKTLFWSCHV